MRTLTNINFLVREKRRRTIQCKVLFLSLLIKLQCSVYFFLSSHSCFLKEQKSNIARELHSPREWGRRRKIELLVPYSGGKRVVVGEGNKFLREERGEMSSMHISAPPLLFAVEEGKESNVWWMILGIISWSFTNSRRLHTSSTFIWLEIRICPIAGSGKLPKTFLLFATSNFQKFQTIFLPRWL